MTVGQDPAPARPQAVFLSPGAGDQIRMGALPLIFKVAPDWTSGAYEMHEQPIPAGTLVAPHTHARQDQVSVVTAGVLGFLVGDQEFAAPTGAVICRPAGVVHALWNPGPYEARMLELSSPGAEIEEFFRAFGELTAAGQATAAAVAQLAAPYGITYDLERISDLQHRHGVSAGAGWWPE